MVFKEFSAPSRDCLRAHFREMVRYKVSKISTGAINDRVNMKGYMGDWALRFSSCLRSFAVALVYQNVSKVVLLSYFSKSNFFGVFIELLSF